MVTKRVVLAWRLAIALYAAAAAADLVYHLLHASEIGDQRVTWSDVVVAFEASLFWPVDLAVRLIAGG